MPEMIFVVAFAMLILLPCGVAIAGLKLDTFGFGELDGFAFFPPRALGARPLPISAVGLERQVTEEFVIRSFPKGLSAKRRTLIQDGVVAAVKTVVSVVADVAEAIADVPTPAEVFPRSRRRGMMLEMLDAKNEADEWMAKAARARAELARLNATASTGPDTASAAQVVSQDARKAGASAAEAYRRVAKMEAMLQGRADAQMPALPAPVVRDSIAA